jgi:hypothetical protein
MRKLLRLSLLMLICCASYAQNDKIINHTIFNVENSKYRWSSCSNLIYSYAINNIWSAPKVKSLIDVLSSDEDKINTTLGDYWKTHWTNKSDEIKAQAQKEFDRNNVQRGNQLTNDAKFAEKISTSIDGVKIANVTIMDIISGKIKPQGNALNLPKEQNLQGFRKYFAQDYYDVYEQLWEPKDENIPVNYTPAPYVYNVYSLLGPTQELMHTFVEKTFSNWFTAINIQPFSSIVQGPEKDQYNYSIGFSLRTKFNFSIFQPLYENEHIRLSHNSFKEILEQKERQDINGLFFGPKLYWSIVNNIAYASYTGKYSNDNFYNIYFSFGSGVNYRFDRNWTFSFNLYYLGFDYQIKSTSLNLAKGVWYYAITPEIETQINVYDLFNLNPYIQYNYHFKGLEKLGTINAGLGISFFLGETTKISY